MLQSLITNPQLLTVVIIGRRGTKRRNFLDQVKVFCTKQQRATKVHTLWILVAALLISSLGSHQWMQCENAGVVWAAYSDYSETTTKGRCERGGRYKIIIYYHNIVRVH